MTVVIDANALVALIASEPDGLAVSELIEQWTAEERELHAPALARYEIANVLARLHAAEADERLTRPVAGPTSVFGGCRRGRHAWGRIA